MKNKHDEGFSLIEILVAIVILTAFVVPTCSALVMSNEMNNRTDALMQAQLAVSSAVETLMAEGIQEKTENYKKVITGLADGIAWESYSEKEILKLTDPEYAAILESRPGSMICKATENSVFSGEVFWIVTPGENEAPFYKVTAISKDGLVEVTTSVRKVS